MKLCRYGAKGAEKPALIDADGGLRDLSGVIDDLTAAALAPESLARLAALDPATLPRVEGASRYGVPVTGTQKFVAIGLNYADHAAESNLPIPAEPVVFNKWVNCLQGANDPVVIPRDSAKTDWEVELGVVIGTRASYVEEADALDHVAGYVVVNDVSERHWQQERGPTWDKGKGFPTFGPVGPWLVTADEVPDPQALDILCALNGEVVQDSSTSQMVFGVAELIATISETMTLEPGDLIVTGTPPGVGMAMDPPRFLAPGDVLTVEIEDLGSLTTTMAGPAA